MIKYGPMINDKVDETTITEVRNRHGDGEYEITKADGWSMWITKKRNPDNIIPKVGDTVFTYGSRGSMVRGVQINNNILWYQTPEEEEAERQKWIIETREGYVKEHKILMEKIKNEEPFDTINMSGMGSGYERCCQLMLKAGQKWLQKHPTYKFNINQHPNIIGVATLESGHIDLLSKSLDKELDEVLDIASDKQCSGAQHQSVINHLKFIHENGVDAWLNEFPADRRFRYPKELPPSSF
jgi:hypothetical protein